MNEVINLFWFDDSTVICLNVIPTRRTRNATLLHIEANNANAANNSPITRAITAYTR